MKKVIKLVLGCLLCLFAIVFLYFAVVLIYGSFTTFNPNDVESLSIQEKVLPAIQADSTISLLTWNIGYGGLGKEIDFFYEGGEMVRPAEVQLNHYFNGISQFLKRNDSIDLILLQEVDFNSKRSYRMDQYEKLMNLLPQYTAIKATNYKSGFVPVPFSEPMGKVHAGMAVFSKLEMKKANRIATPGKHAWPKNLFTLKRCIIIAHLPIQGSNKKLVVTNIHNSAFDDEEELRIAELALLKEYLLKEYKTGNFVVAGGDWNQNPPGFDYNMITKYQGRKGWHIESDFLPADWKWSWDAILPTNRDVKTPFDLQSTDCTILDYFVTSPNVEVQHVQTMDLGFENSDHLPVIIKLKLK